MLELSDGQKFFAIFWGARHTVIAHAYYINNKRDLVIEDMQGKGNILHFITFGLLPYAKEKMIIPNIEGVSWYPNQIMGIANDPINKHYKVVVHYARIFLWDVVDGLPHSLGDDAVEKEYIRSILTERRALKLENERLRTKILDLESDDRLKKRMIREMEDYKEMLDRGTPEQVYAMREHMRQGK